MMIWIILIILILILCLVSWKYVLVPSLTVDTDKDTYDRTETALINGHLEGPLGPLPGKPVLIVIEKPDGDFVALPNATTDASGDYTSDWEIPDDAAGGTYTLRASSLGVDASRTFRHGNQAGVRV